MSFTRLHLHEYWGYQKSAGDIIYVYIFSIIALFLLLIACINFMNLSTARSTKQAREVGMRKVVGASKGHLVRQFYMESTTFAFIALILALLIMQLLLPVFNTLSGKEISLSVTGVGAILLLLVGITLFTGIVAGSYPALFLSTFQPVKVLKGSISREGTRFRRILVVFQFVLSVFLIICTIVVSQQLHYLKNKDLGWDKDHMFYVTLQSGIKDFYQPLKTELKKNPRILGVTGTNQLPTFIGSNSGSANWDGKDPNFHLLVGFNEVDYEYVKTLRIKMSEGRAFSEIFPGDERKNFIINEKMAHIMKKKPVVGERLDFQALKGQVIGVMKDFHYRNTANRIEPLALILSPGYIKHLLVRIKPGDVSATMDEIAATWKRVIPNYPFEYRFLDEVFDRIFRVDQRMQTIIKSFTLLTIFIACLGLFGLASFSVEQRTKEIGIRKVLGASISHVTLMLCREFFFLVLLATIIAWPISYFAMNFWLQDYAYRVPLSPFYFVLAMVLALVIAIFSVSFQAIRAALANPVDSLKYE
ncbi:FtsX-like permease family protein [Acidobacteriota bacterium]